jgi:regulator of sirC expression with transglutaminase-like and TPR domain
MNTRELNALIQLLDDTDVDVFQQIEARLINYGKDVIPLLENAWGSALDAMMQQRIEAIIHKIQLESLQHDLRVWTETGCQDMLKGAILIARYQYADLNEEQLVQHLDKIKRDAWLEMNDNLTALEQIKVMNKVFFEIHGFSGNTQNYHAPQNSFINIALETKRGNPLMLSILYMEVARSAGIPVYGINLPEHFVLGYKDDTSVYPVSSPDDNSHMLFYINPFSKGDIFGRKEIQTFLKQLKISSDRSYFEACTNRDMMQRLIRNLMNAYHKSGYADKVKELEMLMQAVL